MFTYDFGWNVRLFLPHENRKQHTDPASELFLTVFPFATQTNFLFSCKRISLIDLTVQYNRIIHKNLFENLKLSPLNQDSVCLNEVQCMDAENQFMIKYIEHVTD